MNKKYIVRQNGMNDCGSSCLLSIMRYYGFDVSHEELSYILKTNSEGTNAYNIINGSRSFGFDGYGIHYSFEEIISLSTEFPIICHVKKNNMLHFIVVYGIKKNKLIIMDPASDIHFISFEDFQNIYLNTSLVIYPIKKFDKITHHKELFSFIKDYIKLEKKSTIKISILSIIIIFLGIIVNYYILICIDYILPKYEYSLLIKVSILFGTLFIIKNILSFIKNKTFIQLEKNISTYMNSDVITKLFNLPYSFFKSKSTGEVLSRINDIKAFINILVSTLSNIISNIILIIISLFVLLFINSKLVLVNIIGIIFYFIIVILFKNTFTNKTEELLIKEGEYSKCLEENINAYENNKNLNMINDSIKNIKLSYMKNLRAIENYKTSLNNQLFLKDIIVDITYIISITLGIIFIYESKLTIGEFTLFNSIIYFFTDPLKSILDLEPSLNYIKNIYNRINDLIIMNTNIEEENNYKIEANISIYNLSYSHDGLNNIFDNISFNIKYGSKYLIYGKSGIGKSTIMKILLKYYDSYKGEIYLGNVNLKDISSSTIMNNFTYVSQHSYLYNETLKNNIICNRNVSLEEYEKVLEICNLNRLRNNSNLRNNMMIEDNGFNISGGERQKIILARSLLKNSNYIILDEALSEVGVQEEKEIIKKLFEYYKDKTMIYISHKKEIINMFNLKYQIERR